MATIVPPLTKAIYLCDDVVLDPATQKVNLLRVFNSVRPRESAPYPFEMARFCVFAQLIGGAGPTPIRLEIVNARTGEPICFSGEKSLQFPSRLTTVLFRIQNGVFSEPGVYLVEMYSGREFLDDRALHLQ